MNEFEKLYTVEDIANITSLTTRTIRNYLKDGSLQGRKIGGQWRFTMDDIKQLFSNRSVSNDISANKRQQVLDFIDGVNTDIDGVTQICAIIDHYCENQAAGLALSEKFVAVINNREGHFNSMKFDYEFIEKESKARFTLFGDPDYIIKSLQLL